jgi:hypothetical protein
MVQSHLQEYTVHQQVIELAQRSKALSTDERLQLIDFLLESLHEPASTHPGASATAGWKSDTQWAEAQDLKDAAPARHGPGDFVNTQTASM